jgi:hypothetical protein
LHGDSAATAAIADTVAIMEDRELTGELLTLDRQFWEKSSPGDRDFYRVGARAYYEAHDPGPHTAKIARRKLANKLVGILHGCLIHQTRYDELRAWPPSAEEIAA